MGDLKLSATNYFIYLFSSSYVLLWQQSERTTVLDKIPSDTDFEIRDLNLNAGNLN